MKLIIGASSGLGLKLAMFLAFKGHDLVLCSSKIEDLKNIKFHIENSYNVRVHIFQLNLKEVEISFNDYSKNINKFIKNITGVYFMAGQTIKNDPEISRQQFQNITNINFTSIAVIFSHLIKKLPINSFIVFASSVACIRARSSNTTYATAKRSLEFFINGMRHRYPERSKYIKIVRFGYLNTQMTYGQSLKLPKARPFKAALYLYLLNKNTPFISYFPNWWRIFNLLNIIPFYIYKKLHF